MKRLTDLLNIRYPIIQGGMGNISNSILAAAVSNAGGLGMIGCGTMSPEEVEDLIIDTKKRTAKPIGVNIALKVSKSVKQIIELVQKHHVQIVSLSAGNPEPYISALHAEGIKVITVAASVKQAIKAEVAGSDIVVAEGYEAAGINSPLETTTLTLVPQIVRELNIPVVAAGGIADGRGLAAAIMLGASGVQMGTRFVATAEAPFHEEYKRRILQSSDSDTVIVGRSVGLIRRIVKTEYAEKLLNLEKNGIGEKEFNSMTSEEFHKVGALKGDGTNGFMNSGQISGYINDLPTVAELLERMMTEAKQAILSGMNLFH